MAGFSDAYEAGVLNWLFTPSTAISPLASSWVALCITQPVDTDDGTDLAAKEPTYTAYQRVQITNAQWALDGSTDPTAIQNSIDIVFDQCTENVNETVLWWALCTLSTGGDMVFSGDVVVPALGLTLNSGVTPQFDATALKARLGG